MRKLHEWFDTCEFERFINNSLIRACNFVGLGLNGSSDIVEIEVFLLFIELFEDSVRFSSGYG